MNLKEILLLEAVRINNGKEAYELIKNNRIGVKINPSYKSADESIIPYLDKAINDVGANNAPFAIQLLANKVPVNSLGEVVNGKTLKEIVACKNKPWAKAMPEFKEAIDLNSKSMYDENRWNILAQKLNAESGNHGKATKGGGNLEDVKELYNDGTWTLQIPTSWEGAKAASFYGKEGEKQTPTQWCTRADKKYYNMYSKNSPLYIIRNHKTGKAYQVAFDKINVYFLDQNDTEGDEITKGDLSSVPNELLKKIKWNGRTLADFKKESERAEIRKGELENPTSDFKDAEWETPKDEGGGVVSQVMKNLHNSENDSNFVTFMIKGKPFKFSKRNNYAKKYYYKNKPNLIVISVISKNGNIKGDILWPFKIENNNWNLLGNDLFSRLVGDRGTLLAKASEEKVTADNKRRNRFRNLDDSMKNKDFQNVSANMLARYLKDQYLKDGLIDEGVGVDIETISRTKEENNMKKSFGNFIPNYIKMRLCEGAGFYVNTICSIEFEIDNLKCKVAKFNSNVEDSPELRKTIEKSTNKALMSYAKEIIKDKYGRDKRINFREKSKGAAAYDINAARRLQFEDYFPY